MTNGLTQYQDTFLRFCESPCMYCVAVDFSKQTAFLYPADDPHMYDSMFSFNENLEVILLSWSLYGLGYHKWVVKIYPNDLKPTILFYRPDLYAKVKAVS